MRRHQTQRVRYLTISVFCILALLPLTGCSDETAPVVYKNQPPTVWITAGPPEDGVSSYRVEIRWGGFDPDGEIDHYEYCITNNNGAFDPADTTGADKWTGTRKTSDVFVFSADEPVDPDGGDPPAEFRRSHTFFIRSVDNEGVPSPTPAYRSFTARTLSPEVDIETPPYYGINPARIPPIATIHWVATDYIDDPVSTQDPDSVSWILEHVADHNDDWQETIDWIRSLPVDADDWGDWVWYGAPDGSGKQWTTPPLWMGGYVFAIRAKDEAGAITPVFDEEKNLRRLLVSETWPPVLTVTNPYMGSVVTSGLGAPATIMDMPAGLPIEFEWSATGLNDGSTVVAYRYGWDVADPDNPEHWEVDWTPFPPAPPGEPPTARSDPRTFYLGTHVFRVEVMDNSGFRSGAEIKFNILQFPMTRNLMLVDDFDVGHWAGWDNPVGLGILPNETEHDSYWLDVLDNVGSFYPEADMIEVHRGDVIPFIRLADYKSVVWSVLAHVDQTSDYPVLYDLVRFQPKYLPDSGGGKRETNVLALFMAVGGHVLLCGQHPVSMTINDTYAPGLRFPVIFAHELDLRENDQSVAPEPENPTGDDSFAYRELCLETLDFARTDPSRWRNPPLVCPEQIRNNPPGLERDITMRSALPVDLQFPRLDLRPETAGPGRWHDPTVRGLNAELYNPSYFSGWCRYVPRAPRGCFEPIYGLGCLDPAVPGYGQPVAFWTGTYADVVADVPGGVPARSAVFGFPPVLFDPVAGKAAIEHILFDEWRLPRNQ
jgi:hypothetical protein